MKYKMIFKFRATVKADSEDEAKLAFIEKMHDTVDYAGEEKYISIDDEESAEEE